MAPYKRRQLIVDKSLQSKFIVVSLILHALQTIIVVAAIFGPSIYALSLNIPLEQKEESAKALLLLHGTAWPGILLSMCLLSGFTIYFSHKIVGPIYRVKKTLAAITNGDFTGRINLRTGDELHDLADHVNLLAEELGDTTRTLKENYSLQSEQIEVLEKEIESRLINDEIDMQLIAKIKTSMLHTKELLDRFNIPVDSSQ
jgi:signal transduction histidine kinase